MQMKKGNRMKKSVRASRAPLYIALSVFMAMAVVLVMLLAGRSKAFALEIPSGYALGLDALTSDDSGISAVGGDSNKYQIDSAQGFVTLARVSQENSLEGYTFQIAARDVINLTTYGAENSVLTETGFYGIGSENSPFRGKIVYVKGVTADTAIHMTGWKVLFNNLSTKASVTSEEETDGKKLVAHEEGSFALCGTLTVESGTLDISGFRFATAAVITDRPAGLVAAKVVNGEGYTGSCAIDLTKSMSAGNAYEVQTVGTVGGLFGTVESGAALSVTLPDNMTLKANTTGGHAGALVGENKGSFTVDGLENLAATATAGDSYAAGLVGVNSGSVTFANDITVADITATGKYAGGAVGKNEANAALNCGGITLTKVTATGTYTGGVAGASEGSITVAADKTCTVAQATLTATGDNPMMGGFVGQFTAQAETNIQNVTISAATFTGTGTDTAHTVGGYFGLLTANGQVNFTSTAIPNFSFDSVKSGHMGGIIGKVAGNSPVAVSGNVVNNTFRNNDFSGTLGGAVGTVESGIYLKTENLSVSNTMDKMTEGMADLVGVVADGAILDVSGVTYQNTNKDSVLVSKTGKGSVLRLSGDVKDTSTKSGHIVRTQNNSLLYAEGGVNYISAAPTRNDVGNYGQILRNGNIGGIIEFDENAHTVALKEPIPASDIQINSYVDAAKLAITLQTHGVFSGVTGINANNYQRLLSAKITLTDNVDLTNTGVEQFTCAAESAAFTGTINGNNHTLTLAIGETIRKEDANGSTQNVGILRDDANARTYLGAFSALSGATVTNLAVAGSITYADQIEETNRTDKIYIGGLAGYASKSVSISGCTTKVAVTLNGSSWSRQNSVYAGGFIGRAENEALSITGSTVAPEIKHNRGYLNNAGNTVFLGGAIGHATTGKEVTFTDNTVSSKIAQSPSAVNAYVGGCFAWLESSSYVDVNMSGTTANGASVISKASSTAGGLIGHTFIRCRLTLDSAWAGTVSAQSSVGGLLYKLEGKLTVNEDFSVNGSTFTSGTGDRGILLGDGTNAFVIINCKSSGFESVTANGFDLFVGRNISAWASNGVAANGGLLTVETGSADIGKLPESNNGWYALMNGRSNGNTRYYFNVAKLEKRTATSTASTPADLIYWQVYDYVKCLNDKGQDLALPSYVRADSFPTAVENITGAAANVDMSGYCFYPTKKENVTFNFSGNKLTFGVENPPAAAQFKGLQCGVFSDISNGSVAFSNIVLAGTVRPVDGSNSGAFVCGTISGKSDAGGTVITQATVSNVFLSGLKVAGTADYRPLLINTINSYSNCTISDVSQYTKKTYKKVSKGNTYNSGDKAASTLIGRGGVTNGDKLSEYVSVTFKDIVLAGETGDTIFTKATLFDSIACTSSTSSLVYNFNLADDWTDATTHSKAVTYGTELSTNPKQYEYHDQTLIVNPTAYPTQTTGTNGHFTGGYMPYVRATNASSAVLRVNWKVVVFDGGWGTYEHPYEISKPEQLTLLSELVGGTTSSFASGWSIQYPKKNGNTPDYTQGETYTANDFGELKYTDETGGNTAGKTLPVAELLTYIRGAYYKITAETLTAEDGFIGIGNKENPFHGVIVGRDGTNKTTIIMPDKTDIGSEGYGFINTANGCAVYGLKIQYGTVGLKTGQTMYSTSTSRPNNSSAQTDYYHFGGVIAWVIGGDNVVDNVSVSVGTLTVGQKASVFGGYVGFVSGGGVTVRNLGGGVNAEKTEEDSGYFYYNPYVGKVMCGYVLSDKEGQRYNNTDKNYDIPIITKKSAAEGAFKSNTFNLADADDLFMLGFALNGGAFGYADNTVSYGKNLGALSRNGNYAKVGVKSPADISLTGGRYADDETAGGKTIFHSYFRMNKGIKLSGSSAANIDINFTGKAYDLSAYPNAFRGLGSPYRGCELYQIRNVTGQINADETPATTITLNMNMKQYSEGGTIEKDIVENLSLVLERSGSGLSFSNITLSGQVKLTVFNLKNDNGKPLDYKINGVSFCQAGFVNYAENSKFTNVALVDLTVESPGWAGGLVASEFDKGSSSVNKCSISKTNLYGLQSSGAVYAFLRAVNTNLTEIAVTNSEIRMQTSGLNGSSGDGYNASVGGLVGYSKDGKLTVSDSGVSDSSVLVLVKNTTGNTGTYNANAGGLIGFSSSAVTLTDCRVEGSVVAAVLAAPNDSQASEYNAADSATLTNAVYGKAQNMAAYLLDKNVGSINNGSAGGFVGYAANSVNMNSVTVSSNKKHSAVILSSKNAGGFVGETTSTQTYTNAAAAAKQQPIYIIGQSGAAGVSAYSGNTVTATNLTVSGAENRPVYILAKSGAPAAGLFAESNNVTVSGGAVVSNCVISGRQAAGAIAKAASGAAAVGNLKLLDSFIQGTESAAGVFGQISNSATLDGAYLGNNVIRKSGNTNAGVIAGTVNGGKTLTGYDLLLKGNDAGYGTAKSTKEILNAASRNELYDTAKDTDKVGLVAYQNSGTVNILAISSEDEQYPQFVNGTGNCVIFAGYGAPTVFENGYKDNKDYTPKQTLADCGITPAGLESLLNGDPMTKQGTVFTADFLNRKTENGENKLWSDETLHLDSTGMKALSSIVTGVRENVDLPVLHITGQTNDTMAAYLNLITNGGYGTMGSAFHVQSASSARYRLDADGKLSKVEDDSGSIGYENGKFVAGKYDNLESDDKTLSILTVTFADAANSHTYTLHAVVYYPQILAYRSAISALEGEMYQLSAFQLARGTESKIDIMAGSKFSFYVEYAYNNVAEKIEEYNLDKFVYSHKMDSLKQDGDRFTAGTKMVLIDLNSNTAAGFQSYYYTVDADTATINLSDFKRGETVFNEINLQDVVAKKLTGKIADENYPYVERYLMVVIPPSTDQAQRQFNLSAKVPETNEKNITVVGEPQDAKISVWSPPEGELKFDTNKTSQTFSNTADKTLQSELTVRQEFASGYISAMKGRALYGTHILKIAKAGATTGILLPAGTVVTLTKPDGTLLMSTRLAQASTSVRYSVGDIIPRVNGTEYLDDIVISLDFSGVSPLDFNRSFSDNGTYTLQDTFYLSGDREHYVGGTETNCATGTIKAEKASPIKIALVPQDRKRLAINFGNLSETTDDGKIRFDLATDFSAVREEGTTVEKAEVKFSVLKKTLADGKYAYQPLTSKDSVVKTLTDKNGSEVADYTVDLSIPTDGKTSDSFCLTVDVDAIRQKIPSEDELDQNYDFLTNYRLVAEVTLTGKDREEKTVSYTATGYFTFLLCNIHADVF